MNPNVSTRQAPEDYIFADIVSASKRTYAALFYSGRITDREYSLNVGRLESMQNLSDEWKSAIRFDKLIFRVFVSYLMFTETKEFINSMGQAYDFSYILIDRAHHE